MTVTVHCSTRGRDSWGCQIVDEEKGAMRIIQLIDGRFHPGDNRDITALEERMKRDYLARREQQEYHRPTVLGQTARFARVQMRLSLMDVARHLSERSMLGVSPADLSAWELGKKPLPSSDILEAWVEMFDLDLERVT